MDKDLFEPNFTNPVLKAKTFSFNKWDRRFMTMAELVATWSSCLRHNVGCVIVRDKRILTTGYNGAPSGIKSCVEKAECIRIKNNIESGTHQEMCYAVHAEQNAIAQASKLGLSLEGSTLYCTHKPCAICAKIIINSGIKCIIYKNDYPDKLSDSLFEEAEIKIYKMQ